MKNHKNSVSNYQSYDYEKEFWTQERDYEHLSESKTIQSLIKKIPTPIHTIVDAGCGFGRLFPIYHSFGKSFILLDYSKDMLDQAQKKISSESVRYVQGNLYDIPIKDNTASLIISIRTAHHLPELNTFFQELHRITARNGYLIIECPNKRHIKNIFKYILKKNSPNPFNKDALKLSDTFFNYNPKEFEKFLKKYFIVKNTTSSNFFRLGFLKKHVNSLLLSKLEWPLKILFSKLYLTPSQIYLCQKFESASMHETGDKV